MRTIIANNQRELRKKIAKNQLEFLAWSTVLPLFAFGLLLILSH